VELTMRGLRKRMVVVYDQVNGLSGGTLGVISRAFQHFGATRAPQAAAGMAYYAFFSLFPLLLVLVSAGSFVLEREIVQQRLLTYVTQTLPVSQELIKANLERVLALRGPVGLVGLVGLLWSSTGFFNTLAYSINRAWAYAEVRGLVGRRLVALGMVASLAVLLILSLISTAVLDLLPQLGAAMGISASIYEGSLWRIFAILVPWLIKFVLFLALYRWVPNTRVSWRAAIWGAAFAALGWELITGAFSWYLSSGLARYQLVYGSLGAIVALMFWIYLSSWIALFGAHLSASIMYTPGNEELSAKLA
jgi:membrane protein